MKTIALLRGEVTLVDDEDFDCLSRWKWRLKNGYAVRHDKSAPNGEVYMHRTLMPPPPGLARTNKMLAGGVE